MSILRGSVTVGEVILFIDASLAWDQAPQWGKRRKKWEKEVVWKGGNVAAPFPHPQATARLASFADIFPFWPRFLPFSPTAEPGPGLMTVTLWYLRKYLWKTKSQLHVSNTSSSITNDKKKLWTTVRSTSFPKPQLKSVSIFFKFINPCFLLYLLYHLHLLLIAFERLFYSFTLFGTLGTRGFSSRAARSFVGRGPKTRAWPKPKTAHEKPLAHRVSIYWQGWGEV